MIETPALDFTPAVQSYLLADALLAAALGTGCDAIHPGYGFMAENAGFARRCSEHGLTFVGPSPEAIELMGDKIAGRAAAIANGVPVVPGSDAGISDISAAKRQAEDIGYPLLLKASAGGGGRGMRVVNDPSELESRRAAAGAEAETAFSDSRIYMERHFPRVHHVEVQVFGDRRLERVFHIDIELCGVCGATLRVIACIDTPLKCRSRSELARSSRGSSLISPPARPAPSTTPAHRPSVWAPRNPAPPITDHLLTAPTGAPRPRCASSTALRPTPCLTRSHHCRLHNFSSPRPRNVCARTDNPPANDHTSSNTPLLLQQRRSASYFSYPSRYSSPDRTGLLYVERREVARLPAELHRDEPDRLARAPVLVSVSPGLQLLHRRALRRHLDHLELEQIDVAPEAHRHVQPAVARAVLHRDVEPRRREVRVEHACVVALVLRDVVLPVPVMGNAGEEEPEQRLQAFEVVRRQQLVQPDTLLHGAHGVRQHRVQQALFRLCLTSRFG